jgi:hypothetical protein
MKGKRVDSLTGTEGVSNSIPIPSAPVPPHLEPQPQPPMHSPQNHPSLVMIHDSESEFYESSFMTRNCGTALCDLMLSRFSDIMILLQFKL